MKTRTLLAAAASALLLAVPAGPAGAHEEEPPRPPTGNPVTTTPNMRLLGHVNPGAITSGDVFGFNRHAYLASWIGNSCPSGGVRVYDLADPAHPGLVSIFADKVSEPDLVGTWTEKVIVQRVETSAFSGDLAVVTFQACNRYNDETFRGFALYDVTDPAHPHPLARYATPGARGSHEIWLGSRAGKAYVYTAIVNSEWTSSPTYDRTTNTATTPGRADFRIIDVADPRNPVDVSEWGAWRQLGVVPVSNPSRPRAGFQSYTHSVRVNDNLTRAYLSYWDLGTVILDISAPARPTYLGRTQPPQGSAHSTAVDPSGQLLIETHERLGGLPFFYDISDPAHPRELAHLHREGAEETSVHDPKMRGNLVYFSWYDHGIVVADISNPAEPAVVGQFMPDDPTPNPEYCDFVGGCPNVWGIFVLGDLILASDMNSGLYVLRMAGI